MALPIWLAEELWTDEGVILEDEQVEEAKLLKAQKGKKKRKTLEAPTDEGTEKRSESKKRKVTEQDGESRKKKATRLVDDDLSQEMKERREKLRQQKKEARAQLDQENAGAIPSKLSQESEVPSKKERRRKKAVEVV
jgi:ribosome biogenesis protein UTP30